MLANLFYRIIAAVTEMPRNRVTFRLVDSAHHFLYGRSMKLSLPWLCGYCAYRIRKGERHEACEREHNGENESSDSEDDQAWHEYQMQLKAEEDAEWRAFEDQQHLKRLMASFCTEEGCFEEAINIDDKCDAHTADVTDSYDEEDAECPGGCGQTERTCTCAELESLRQHNANPATRGSWWVA